MPTVVDNPRCEVCGRAIWPTGGTYVYAYVIAVYYRIFRAFWPVQSRKYYRQMEVGLQPMSMFVCGLEHGRTRCQSGQFILMVKGGNIADPLNCWDHTGQQLNRFW